MYHLISMDYPVIQCVITGLECFMEKHTHTYMGTCIHTCKHGLVGFFSLACLAVSYVTGTGEMFLAPSARNEGTVVLAYFLPKAHTNFATNYGDVLHSPKVKPVIKENFSVRINHCSILLLNHFFTCSFTVG